MKNEFQFKASKADLYKAIRDKSAVEISDKHLRQFDTEFFTFTETDQSMSVLDIGCGTGLFLRYLLHRGFTSVTGIDYDENLKGTLSDLEQAGCGIEFSEAEAYIDANLGVRYFDRIVLFDILEHIELDDCVRFLRKLHGVLNAGGKILIRVPNITSPWGIRMQFDSFDHVTIFSPGRLHELAAYSDLKIGSIAGQVTGKRRKVLFQQSLHWILSRVLAYHPEFWEASLICTFEKK
jgi:2-polyprenyl-3-methyl-5-hydroxy-6-metoxy-1,4-benzoquinol methylase